MKNLIDPKLLADLTKENITVQEVVDFLDNNPTVRVNTLANIINMLPVTPRITFMFFLQLSNPDTPLMTISFYRGIHF